MYDSVEARISGRVAERGRVLGATVIVKVLRVDSKV